MEKQFGVAIVGTGWVSAEHIRAFNRNEHCQVVALVSRTMEKGNLRKQTSKLTDDVRVYTRLEDALNDPRVNIVAICTPNHLHADQTVLCAKAGKHILIEKPISLNWEDALRMKEAVDRAGIKTLVGYVLHWNPLFLNAKKMLDDYIGKLFYAEVDYFHRVVEGYPCYAWTCKKDIGGSSLLAGGCHAVDALRWFMQSDAVEVSAMSSKCRTDLEFDGTLSMLVRFANGAMGKVGSSYDIISPYIFNLHLFGDKGSLLNEKLYSPQMIDGQLGYMSLPVTTPNSGDVEHHPFPEEVNEFVNCILADRQPELCLDDAMKTQALVFAADESARTGKPVKPKM